MLHELERKQLLRKWRDLIGRTEPQYACSHALVRDVAYEQIPRARRSRKHWRTAGWIESLSPERTEDRAEMLSHHYMRALRYLPQGDTVSIELLAAARSALCDAGDRSMSLNAFAEAAHIFSEALQLWPQELPGWADVAFRLGSAQVH